MVTVVMAVMAVMALMAVCTVLVVPMARMVLMVLMVLIVLMAVVKVLMPLMVPTADPREVGVPAIRAADSETVTTCRRLCQVHIMVIQGTIVLVTAITAALMALPFTRVARRPDIEVPRAVTMNQSRFPKGTAGAPAAVMHGKESVKAIINKPLDQVAGH
jgi:lysylphosphatidylglycerol synthetase-like protein (DUF2156 family)